MESGWRGYFSIFKAAHAIDDEVFFNVFLFFLLEFTGLDFDRLEHPRMNTVRASITGLLFKNHAHNQGSRLSIASFAQAIDISTVKVRYCFSVELIDWFVYWLIWFCVKSIYRSI